MSRRNSFRPKRHIQEVLWIAIVSAVAIALVFGRTLSFEALNWDDDGNVYENPLVVEPTLSRLADFWRAPYEQLYIPVTYTSVFVDRMLFGPFPGVVVGMRITSLVLHWLATLAVFALGRQLTLAVFPAGIVALLFALHPLQVEPVVWLSSRKDLLCGLFTLSAFLCGLRWSKLGRIRMFVLATILYALALLSKPSAVGMAPMLTIAVLLNQGLRKPRWLFATSVWWALAGGVAIVTSLQQAGGLQGLDFVVSLWRRPLVMADSLAFYVTRFAVPFDLAPHNVRQVVEVSQSWWAIMAFAVFLLLLYRSAKSQGLLAFLFAWYCFALLPNSGLVPFFYQAFSSVADRYAYIAIISPAIGFGMVLNRFEFREKFTWAMRAGAGILVVAYGAMAWHQAAPWRNNETFWSNQLRVTPNNSVALINLAIHRTSKGDKVAALPLLERAVALPQSEPRASITLLRLYDEIGLIEKRDQLASATVQRFGRSEFTSVDRSMAVGTANMMLGRCDAAADSFRQAVFGLPDDPESNFYLGMALMCARRWSEAEGPMLVAANGMPGAAQPLASLAGISLELNRMSDAMAYANAALTLDAKNATALRIKSSVSSGRP